MTLLVLGSRGQLGWTLLAQGAEVGLEIAGADLPELDITNPEALRDAIAESGARIVVNAAAYTAVDRAEAEPERAFMVNRDSVALLAAICEQRRLPLIHISTDYVYDGQGSRPYREDDPITPIGIYGQSKAEGEVVLREGLASHIIIRTAWLYGVHGQNFVKTMLRLGGEREKLQVVADQTGCPTYAGDLAAAILRIARRFMVEGDLPWGTYHFCGAGMATWHAFALAIFEEARHFRTLAVRQVEPITTGQYPTAARRPAYTVLDCGKIETAFGIRPPPWRESLSFYFKAIAGQWP